MIHWVLLKKCSLLSLALLTCLYFLSPLDIHIPNLGLGRSLTHPPQYQQTDWQAVKGSWCVFVVYSAYALMDRQVQEEEVVIMGVTKTDTNETVNCRFYFRESEEEDQDKQEGNLNSTSTTEVTLNYEDVPGRIETTLEHRFRFYAAAFIKCPLPSWKPQHVSVILRSETETDEATNKLEIQYKSEPKWESDQPKYNYTFSVCVNPAYHYNEVFHLIEWLEFHKLMGVEQFTLFNVSFGPDSSCILNDLVEGNDPSIKMNVYPYHNVPITKRRMIKGRCTKCALSAAANDCLYRHRGRLSKYMVFVDFDEFIMPREHIAQNYSRLIDYLDAEHPTKNISHYSFRNGFFFMNRPDDPLLPQRCGELKNDLYRYTVCQKSYIMSKEYRDSYSEAGIRTKYIIKPEGVTEASTHYALQLEPGYALLNVSAKVAFSRHYREKTFATGPMKLTVTDRVTHRFGLRLVENVAERLKYFTEKCKFKVADVLADGKQRKKS